MSEVCDKATGYFRTPEHLVRWMVELASPRTGERILEPACGDAPFLKEIAGRVSGVEAYAVDIVRRGEIPKEVVFYQEDFLLWESGMGFDLIIGNPPYGIPTANSEHYPIRVSPEVKKEWKRVTTTWLGKYNLYGAFIEKAVRLLNPGGRVVFVVPGSFLFLRDFKRLRQFLALRGRSDVYYHGRVFPNAMVSVVVLKFTDGGSGIYLYETDGRLINAIPDWHGEPVFYESDFTREIDARAHVRIGDLFTIHMSPRTTEMRRFKWKTDKPRKGYIPVYDSRHLRVGWIDYDKEARYYIPADKKTFLRDYFDIPHVVVGHGYRKGYIACAYDSRASAWWGDVYHLFAKSGVEYDHDALVQWLSSEDMARYVRDKFRDVVYHLSVVQLSVLPVSSGVRT